VVIVDLQCGSAGGFSLARDMRDDPALTDVPIFLVLERPEDVWLAKQSGADGWTTKPVDGHRLVRETLALLDR
jgi:DNA-binding response OmpR family regulator